MIGFILIGLAAGFLAGQVMKGKGFGFWANLGLGVAGSFVGKYLAKILNIKTDGSSLASLAIAFGGAMLLLYLSKKIKK